MNLYFRLLLILFKSKFAKRVGVLDTGSTWFRVWPLDCDINLHLTNARYFSFCDLSRIYFMGQTGILFKMIKRKWLPIAQSQEITYLKAIQPFQKVEVQTRLSYWDSKYWYIEHKFMVGDQLCAVLQVRGVFVHGRNKIPTADLLALTGEDFEVPNKPAKVEQWQKMNDVKKEG